MAIPILMLVGQAGSGKDTVANYLVNKYKAISIAQADPIKRLSKYLFEFTEEQLWGPSEFRNISDNRDKEELRKSVLNRLLNNKVLAISGDIGLSFTVPLHFKLLQNCIKDIFSKPNLTPRYALQILGTEWGRSIKRDIWVNYAKRSALKLLSGEYTYDKTIGLVKSNSINIPSSVVISDGRFVNEILSVSENGGQVWKIENPDANSNDAHPSENEQKSIPDTFFDGILFNYKSRGLEFLYKNVDSFWSHKFVSNR